VSRSAHSSPERAFEKTAESLTRVGRGKARERRSLPSQRASQTNVQSQVPVGREEIENAVPWRPASMRKSVSSTVTSTKGGPSKFTPEFVAVSEL